MGNDSSNDEIFSGKRKIDPTQGILDGKDAEQFFNALAERAMEINEKANRDRMRYFVSEFLKRGRPLPDSARRWLVYLLEALSDVPPKFKGAPRADYKRLCNSVELAHFIVQDTQDTTRNIGERLEMASKALPMGKKDIERMYYHDDFFKEVLKLMGG